MHVSELWIYPIKSCRGIGVDALELDDRGPRHDRRWMLVDEDNQFITARTEHRLVLVDVAIRGDDVLVSAPGMSELLIAPPDGPREACTVWRDTIPLVEAGARAHEWFTDFLGKSCRLMHMPAATHRIVDRDYVPEERYVTLADAFPMMLIGQGSLDLLNEKLAEPIPMKRFRPNIVVADTEPHVEDTWTAVRIGEVDCVVPKLCARCAVPTIDTATGIASKEPTRTLSTYRKRGGKVVFGVNVLHQAFGRILLDDEVSGGNG